MFELAHLTQKLPKLRISQPYMSNIPKLFQGKFDYLSFSNGYECTKAN